MAKTRLTTRKTKATKRDLEIEAKKIYVKKHLKAAFQYEKDVESGKIIACDLIKKAIARRRELHKKYYYNESRVEDALKFFFYVNISAGKKPEQFNPLPWMAWVIMNIYGYHRDKGCDKKLFRYVTIWVSRKSAKALSLDTPIPTPEGWTTMGDLLVGDKIFSVDGSVTSVTHTSEVFFNKDVYEVLFEDGEVIKASGDHIWDVKTKDSRRRASLGKTPSCTFNSGYDEDSFNITTREMKDDIYRDRSDGKGREYKYRVPMQKPIVLPEKDLLIDPYLLGLWLGDGHSSGARITSCEEDIRIYDFLKNQDKYTISYGKDSRNSVVYLSLSTGTSCFLHELKELNLIKNKHIPTDYLRGSVHQRTELLKGLMDSDGTISKEAKCSFTQKSKAVTDGMSELLGSLGIKHSIKKFIAKLNGKDCGEAYKISFFTDKTRSCFKMKRKHDRLKEVLAPRMLNKTIIGINRIESEPTKCISVDNKSELFLAGNRFTATHNTTLAAIFSLYALVKGQREAEVFFCATTKDQASQALKYLKQIVADSPALRSRVKRQQYRLLFDGNGSCIAKPVANEPDKLDGLKPSFVIVDEKHAFPTNDLFNIMKTGILASHDPQMVTISTAGFHREYPFYKEIEIGKKVLNGDIEDDSTFYGMYTLDDESEIDNTDMWIKSNPSLKDKNGVGVIHLEDLIVDYKKACLTITDKKNFTVKNLNVFVDGEDTWIPDEDYRKCFNDVDLKDLIGQKCYLGFDLSRTRDLASLVAVFEHPVTKKVQVFPEFFFPSDSGENKIRASGIDLTEWIDDGYIHLHKGKTIDESEVFDRISYYNDNFDVQAIGYDPWFMIHLVSRIESELMLNMVACKQNTAFYTFPMKYLERLIYSDGIDMSTSPVLRWNFMNAVPYYGGNDDCKLMKNKSLDSIDGAVATLMALAMYAKINFDAVAALMENLNERNYGD